MRKIRIKFCAIAAFSLLVVLFSIIFGLNITNYNTLKNDAYTNSNVIINNSEPFSLPTIEDFDPETIYRSRYFIATYDEDNELINLDASRVVRITSEEAKTLANKVYKRRSKTGFKGIYYYRKYTQNNMNKIIFLDCQMELEVFNTTLKASIFISSIGYALVLILIFWFSFLIIKPIEEANDKQKRFITDASHELKTPLTVINSNLSIIEMENGPSEWSQSIKKQVDKLTDMTNELVLLSKLNENELRVNKTKIELNDFIDEVCGPYINVLKQKDIDLIFEVENDLYVDAEPRYLAELFTIMLDNMSKYALKGEAKITAKKQHNSALIIFSNKIDIKSKIDTKAIFDRFYKEDESRNSKTNSFGIGLSMAKAIVSLHKGKINCYKENDKIFFKIVL